MTDLGLEEPVPFLPICIEIKMSDWCACACRELAAENAALKAELLELRTAVTHHLAAHASSLPYAQSIALSQVRQLPLI